MNIKTQLLIFTLALGISGNAVAQVTISETYNVSVGGPAGIISDQGVPSIFTQSISSSAINYITEVQATLYLVGANPGEGWAGDMFVSLNRNGGATSILLNQPGVIDANSTEGFGFDGWNVSFRDGAANGDIHLGTPTSPATILIGEWQPDGRQSALSSSRDALLKVFKDSSANADWHLTLADLNPIGAMRLESWSITISGSSVAVPEPAEWSVIATLGLGGLALWRRCRRSKEAVEMKATLPHRVLV